MEIRLWKHFWSLTVVSCSVKIKKVGTQLMISVTINYFLSSYTKENIHNLNTQILTVAVKLKGSLNRQYLRYDRLQHLSCGEKFSWHSTHQYLSWHFVKMSAC